MSQFAIPEWMLHHLNEIPEDRSVCLLIRHSVRDPLPPDDVGYALPITEEGRRLARNLGEVIGSRLKTLHSSPLDRCTQTADEIMVGAGETLPVFPDRLLGDPGVFVLDGQVAWPNWQRLGNDGMIAKMVEGGEPLPGLAKAELAAGLLVDHMLKVADQQPGIHVFVTHDSIAAPTIAHIHGCSFDFGDWPAFLEGAFFWANGADVEVHFRAADSKRTEPLVGFTEAEVLEFGRRQIAQTIGLASGAHFHLAGGAFKSLITGRNPYDLDVWPASEDDRERLISALLARGAEQHESTLYAHVFEIAGRRVEIPYRNVYPELESTIAQFDISLAAIGVEHRDDGHCRAYVHPSAFESILSGQVTLQRPLANWKYAFATLERLRRYSAELGFTVVPEDETHIWQVFEEQEPFMKEGMIERYHKVARGGFGVEEELACRHQ